MKKILTEALPIVMGILATAIIAAIWQFIIPLDGSDISRNISRGLIFLPLWIILSVLFGYILKAVVVKIKIFVIIILILIVLLLKYVFPVVF